MAKKKQSRQGVHSDDKYRVQAYYTSRDKALFVLVAKADSASLTDTIRRCIRDRARALGILGSNGDISPDFAEALTIESSIIEQADRKQKGNEQ